MKEVFYKVNGRAMFRVFAFMLVVAIAAGLAVVAYNAGMAAGFNQAVQQAVQSGQPVPVVPYPYAPYGHGGIGFFGIFFWIIGFFLLIGLIRAAFGFGRGGRGGWGKWDQESGPGGYYGRGDRVSEWHRELHRREESGESDTEQGRPTAGA